MKHYIVKYSNAKGIRTHTWQMGVEAMRSMNADSTYYELLKAISLKHNAMYDEKIELDSIILHVCCCVD